MTQNTSLATVYSNPLSSGTQLETGAVQTDLIELSTSYTAESRDKGQRLRLFGEAGGGGIAFNANHAQAEAPIIYHGLGLAGVGVDWRLTNHLGLRAEYRGLLTPAPDWGPLPTYYHPAQRPLTLISEPTVSLVYRFGGKKAAK